MPALNGSATNDSGRTLVWARPESLLWSTLWAAPAAYAAFGLRPWQSLNFLPEPQGQG